MASYSVNKPNRTLTLHKPGCRHVPLDQLRKCGCGSTSDQRNQRWWCEDHMRIEAVEKFLRYRFWAVLLCDTCFGRRGVGELW